MKFNPTHPESLSSRIRRSLILCKADKVRVCKSNNLRWLSVATGQTPRCQLNLTIVVEVSTVKNTVREGTIQE